MPAVRHRQTSRRWASRPGRPPPSSGVRSRPRAHCAVEWKKWKKSWTQNRCCCQLLKPNRPRQSRGGQGAPPGRAGPRRARGCASGQARRGCSQPLLAASPLADAEATGRRGPSRLILRRRGGPPSASRRPPKVTHIRRLSGVARRLVPSPARLRRIAPLATSAALRRTEEMRGRARTRPRYDPAWAPPNRVSAPRARAPPFARKQALACALACLGPRLRGW